MKKTIFILSGIIVLIITGLLTLNPILKGESEVSELRKQHESFLRNSPFKETLLLSKKERKARGLRPNKYFERQWELTMDPETGKPENQRLFELQKELQQKRLFSKVPGENSNEWVERGPNNVGGRTRAIMYDPNDNTNKRVFAGGVSGGLWKNEDITNSNSGWTEVNIPQNLAISSLTYDPNTTTTFYAGTGESYVQGSVNGNGVWKSIDAGLTWTHIFGGITANGQGAKVIVNNPVSIAGEYTAIQAGFGSPLTKITGNLVLVDDGSSSPTEACNILINSSAINGNIAVLERGSCNFDIKVKNAENAGAIAVIVVNNSGGASIVMGGDDYTIFIPAIMISQSDGQAIIAELGSGVNVSLESDVSPTTENYLTPGIQHINDIKIRDVGSTSEIYVAAAPTLYTSASPFGVLGLGQYGLYKSTDNGASWSLIELPSTGGDPYVPNDIEIGFDNTIWLATTGQSGTGNDGAGTILSSSNGITFTVKTTISNGVRTQIATSTTDADFIYVLSELSDGSALSLVKTEDGFATAPSVISQPQDVDTAERLVDDFTGGQAGYNLLLEVDPSDHSIVYVGGIDLFRSADAGSNWAQISKWSNNNDLRNLAVSLVHADQHALAFNPDDPNIGIFSNDGGVYYSSTLSSASTSTSAISARNKDYNTVQFYNGAIGQEVNPTEKFLAGSQDNGSLLIHDNTGAIDAANEVTGGDGAYVFIDEDSDYMISSFVYNNYFYLNYTTGSVVFEIASNDDLGDFINPAAHDSDNNILYANATDNTTEPDPTYQINRYTIGNSQETTSTETLSNNLMDGAPTAFKTSNFTTSNLFVGTDNGKLFKLTNANLATPTWSEITGTNFIGSISCVDLGTSENDIYVTFYNYGVTNIFYSPDGGTSWQNKEGDFPDIPVRTIMVSPDNSSEVIIGTDLGVWATSNFNELDPHWTQSQNGMKDVKVTSFDFRNTDNTVLASTYGRGLFTGLFSSDPNGDIDGDGILNGVDNCRETANADQTDIDNNGIGDACQDTDGDSILDIDDNCPLNFNPNQEDNDNNGIGNACEDTDGDGISNDIDNCITIANPEQLDQNNNGIGDLCDTSYEAADNFTLEINSETCPGLQNGFIKITANETFVNYIAKLTGNGLDLTQPFSSDLSFDNLPIGSYLICLEVEDRNYEQCFEINIDAAEELDIEFGKNGTKLNSFKVNIKKGTAPFDVSLNGELLFTSNEKIFKLNIDKSGLLEISSSKTCEGIFTIMIDGQLNNDIIVGPNPVSNNLTLSFTNINQKQIPIQIFNSLGEQVYNELLDVKNNRGIISFKNFKVGVYYIKVNTKNLQVLKIIKQ